MSLTLNLPICGLGELAVLESFPPIIRNFLRDAADEDPSFVGEYLVPKLQNVGAFEEICGDLEEALIDHELEKSGLGYLGKGGFFRKVGKAIKKVASQVKAVHARVEKAIMPKEIRKFEKKATKEVTKVWVKYGPIILEVVGAILTVVGVGPIIMAAASVLAAANEVYQRKIAAQRAVAANAKNAAQLQAQAAQAQAQNNAQIDQFFNQNQSWFAQYGVTPDKWAQLTPDQKIDLINALSKGQLPPGSVATVGPDGTVTAIPPSMPIAQSVTPSGGGVPGAAAAPMPTPTDTSGGGGGGPSSMLPTGTGYQPPSDGGFGPSGSTSPYQPGGSAPQGQQQPIQAGMMGGGLLVPALVVGAAIAFSGKGKGGSRRRRNPSRRRR